MFLKEDTFLKPLKKITLNQEEQKKYDASYKHFIDNRYKFFIFIIQVCLVLCLRKNEMSF